ncbi:MAG TPA: EthD family reductase [Nitrolancea sp.]|nr:EthD family reductase [Nitrolancea sp.]
MPKVKVVALYRKPEDVAAFMQHYQNVHLPLVRQTPGLERLEVDRVTASASGGEPEYFLITGMIYPDQETFRAAVRSDANKAVMQDVQQFAGNLITVLIAEVLE